MNNEPPFNNLEPINNHIEFNSGFLWEVLSYELY